MVWLGEKGEECVVIHAKRRDCVARVGSPEVAGGRSE